eukprot:TRINITY_DN7242_c0_g1_i1.p1 TRINITY_DN7242_c0_g1~~TRINITY_DN7242_c0_g1_i1.p1  ORF type:complete len:151 (+),score=47.44 TRINITY_DN7242_c0_g1_i1:194-646(+)
MKQAKKIANELLIQKSNEMEKEFRMKNEEKQEIEEYVKLKDKRKIREPAYLNILEKESNEKKRVQKSKQIKKILNNDPSGNTNYKFGEEELMEERKEKLVNDIEEINPKLKSLLFKVLGQDGVDLNKLYKGKIPKDKRTRIFEYFRERIK